MRLPKRGERGFTLIELLIVIAILGVLAAVVIPNVGRFIGRGEDEAKDTEFANIQSAMLAMMVDNTLSTIATTHGNAANATNNMSDFPNATQKLFQMTVDGLPTNYVASNNTAYYYYVDSQGSVSQNATSP
ncbi:type II secretion system protein [Chloroflexota bacterium]